MPVAESATLRELEFRIPADTRYVALVRHGVRSLGQSAGFRREDVADMEIAVSEAVTNSVTHGSPDPCQCSVVVRCRASAENLVVEVEDAGQAEAITPRVSAEEGLCESGRGVAMMCALVDEFEGCRTERGTRVRIAKQRR